MVRWVVVEANLPAEHAGQNGHAVSLRHGLAQDREAAVRDGRTDEIVDADDNEDQAKSSRKGS